MPAMGVACNLHAAVATAAQSLPRFARARRPWAARRFERAECADRTDLWAAGHRQEGTSLLRGSLSAT